MRRIVSLILLVSFLVLSVTGIQLALPHDKSKSPAVISTEAGSPSTVVAERTGPPFYPKGMHEWAGYIFIVAGLGHVILNRKPIKSYLKRRKC